MASPSPDSPPSGGVSPPPTITPPPPPAPSTPGVSPPPLATPPTPSAPPPSSNLSPPITPPPSNSVPPPVTPPPVVSSPPPKPPSAPPPTPTVSPPLTPVTPQTPPPVASPPPSPSFSPPPPQGDPPTSSPPPGNAPPPSPPVAEPPPPGILPPPTNSPPPPKSTPTPSSPDPPAISPPPSQSPPNPPADSPPPPSPSKTPESPPSPPVKSPPPAPRGSPSQPAAPSPPKDSPPPPSGGSPPSTPSPPSQPHTPPPKNSPSPPSGRRPPSSPSPPSHPNAPGVHNPPSSPFTPPGPSKSVPSPPSLPSNETISGPPPSSNGLNKSGAIAIGVVSGIVILGLIGLIAFWMLKRKKRSSGANNGLVIPASTGSSPRSDNQLVKSDNSTSNFGGGSDTDHGGFGHSRSWFTYHELSEATGGFSDENLLGEGGFGCVYKGQLVDGRVVAVKRLKIGGGQGEREFKAEVEIISRIHHRHLVSLVGYCIWESKRLLVYDYVPNNTLNFHLHGEGTPVLDWATRVKIAVGAARGITYLHEDCHPRIIHRDIKSSNILIDNNYEAQVSDFGLAKLAMDADTHVSTRVMGTFGYMAPEYATSGKLTDKSDVFSFGVVLLELITGRKPVDSTQPLGDESLVQWARPLLTHALDTGEFDGLVDPRLDKNYIESEVYRMIEAAAACVRHSSSKRPKMGQIVRALGVTDTGDLTNGLKVGESQLYTSAQQSADIRWFRRMAFGNPDSSSEAFSQPTTQNSGYSTNSRQDMYFSAQPVQGGTSGQFSQAVQNRSLSGQHEINVDVLDERLPDANISRQPDQTVNMYFSAQPAQGGTSGQFSQASHNRSSSGQHEINVDILDVHSPDASISRQQNQNAHHSTDQASQNV